MPDTAYPYRKLLYMSAEQAEQVSEFRHAMRIGSENEAIRRLLALGLIKAAEIAKEAEASPSRCCSHASCAA